MANDRIGAIEAKKVRRQLYFRYEKASQVRTSGLLWIKTLLAHRRFCTECPNKKTALSNKGALTGLVAQNTGRWMKTHINIHPIAYAIATMAFINYENFQKHLFRIEQGF